MTDAAPTDPLDNLDRPLHADVCTAVRSILGGLPASAPAVEVVVLHPGRLRLAWDRGDRHAQVDVSQDGSARWIQWIDGRGADEGFLPAESVDAGVRALVEWLSVGQG